MEQAFWPCRRTRGGDCAKSVFATIECELFDQQPGGRFTSRREAKLANFDYLEALSRYAGDPLPGQRDRSGEDLPWRSTRACSALPALAAVS